MFYRKEKIPKDTHISLYSKGSFTLSDTASEGEIFFYVCYFLFLSFSNAYDIFALAFVFAQSEWALMRKQTRDKPFQEYNKTKQKIVYPKLLS